jgi:hypothetical protein
MTPMTHQFQKFNYAQSAQCHFCNSKFLDNNFKKIKFHSKLNTLVANENFFWTSEKVASSHFKSWTESEFSFGSCISRKCLFRVLLFGICENRDATMNLVLTVGRKIRIQRRFWMDFYGMINWNCRFVWLWSFDLNFGYLKKLKFIIDSWADMANSWLSLPFNIVLLQTLIIPIFV